MYVNTITPNTVNISIACNIVVYKLKRGCGTQNFTQHPHRIKRNPLLDIRHIHIVRNLLLQFSLVHKYPTRNSNYHLLLV